MPTRWRPDTCGCEIDNFHDGSRSFSSTFITRCPMHLEESEAIVVAECAGRNAARSLLMDAGIDGADIGVRFTANGRGKRECLLSVPAGSPDIPQAAIIARLAEWGYPASFSDRITIVPRK